MKAILSLSIVIFVTAQFIYSRPFAIYNNMFAGDSIYFYGDDSLKLYQLEPISIIGEKTRSIPSSGQYISSRKLAIINQPNINQVLRIIPGVNVRDEEGFGLRPNIGLRGTSVNRSSKVTLMEDGILMAPAPYSDPSAYYFPTFVRMHAIEVLKGSSQIKNGPYTIGGAVNLISTPIPDAFKGFAQLSYGSFGTNQQRLWVGDSRKNVDYVFEINRLASDGFKDLDNGANTGFERRDMMGKVRWHTNENAIIKQSLTLKFVNTSEVGNESYLGLTYEDFKKNPLRRYAATQKDILDMRHQHITLQHTIIPRKDLYINTTAYHTKTFRDWARVNTIGGQSLNNILANPTSLRIPYQIMTGAGNGNIDYQSAARTYFAKGIQSYAQYFFKTGEANHKVQLGIRHHLDQADRYATRSVYTMTNGNMILTSAGILGNQENQIRDATATSAYFSYDIVYKGLKLSPGIRYENIRFDIKNFGNADNSRQGVSIKSAENSMSIILPGFGVNYDINEKMNLFGGVHKGFSPPGMPSTTSVEGQAQVETAINYELGYRYDHKALNLQLVGFYSDYNNILGSDNVSGGGAGTGELFNAGNAKVTGLEFSIGYHLVFDERGNYKMPVNVAYTYTNARFKETFVNAGGDWGTGTIHTDDLIPFITPHLFAASIGYQNPKFNTTLSARYVGTTRTKPGQGELLVPSESVMLSDINAISSFLIADLSTNYSISNTFGIFATINNLTNNKTIVANLPNGYRPNMPFSVNIGLKIDF